MNRAIQKKAATSNPQSEAKGRGLNPHWSLRAVGSLQVLESKELAGLDWLVHGFSTRIGGQSELETACTGKLARVKALNLGFTEWDARDNVIANRNAFVHAIGADRTQLVALRQVHSDIVHRAGCAGTAESGLASSGNALKGDALLTRESGVLLTAQTADCIPVLLADTKRRAIAAIHAGWRGALQRIAAKAVGRMRMEFGSRPEDVIAALGPGIGRCCYQVGHEVTNRFAAQFPDAREWFDGPFDRLAAADDDPNWLPWLAMKPPGHAPPPMRVYLDLIAANRSILNEAGVPLGQISSCDCCTACRSDLFFSYRRERTAGRMMAAIAIR